jgi:hypothetical protein
MLTASTAYRQALPYAHRRETRVQVYQSGVLVGDSDTLPGLLPVAGEVSANLTSRVTRTLRMDTDPALFSTDVNALLSSYHSVLKVSSGIGYPNGSREIFPIFTGRIYESERAGNGGMHVECEDLASDVIAYQFESPQVSVKTNTIVQEIHRLIGQAIDSPTFGVDNVGTALTPSLVWDTDRGKALDDLAQALAARWYALGDGSFVVREYPYTAGVPVLTLSDASGGTTMTADRTVSRVGTYNSIVVVSERMDGTAPIRAIARDTDPSSPTYFGGPFGKVSNIVKVQTPLSQGQAEQLALMLLAASTALAEQWSIDCVPDNTIEPGDTIGIDYRGVTATQVIDSMTYPLTANGAMRISTRSSVPVPAVIS